MLYIEKDNDSQVVSLKAYDFLENIDYFLIDISCYLNGDTSKGWIQYNNGSIFLGIRIQDVFSFYSLSIENGKRN
jgi:hypothetical protein